MGHIRDYGIYRFQLFISQYGVLPCAYSTYFRVPMVVTCTVRETVRPELKGASDNWPISRYQEISCLPVGPMYAFPARSSCPSIAV
jgi:hypothetical protein